MCFQGLRYDDILTTEAVCIQHSIQMRYTEARRKETKVKYSLTMGLWVILFLPHTLFSKLYLESVFFLSFFFRTITQLFNLKWKFYLPYIHHVGGVIIFIITRFFMDS